MIEIVGVIAILVVCLLALVVMTIAAGPLFWVPYVIIWWVLKTLGLRPKDVKAHITATRAEMRAQAERDVAAFMVAHQSQSESASNVDAPSPHALARRVRTILCPMAEQELAGGGGGP